MEDILFYGSAIVVGATLGWVIVLWAGVLFDHWQSHRADKNLEWERGRFRAEWVAIGVRSAARGDEHVDSLTPWIQDFYDEGYNSVTIIKEAANV